VTEAKARDGPLTEGVAQAKDYAGKMAVRFAHATNGQGVYGVDLETGLHLLAEGGHQRRLTRRTTPLLRLKYHDSLADAVADLGRPDEIGRAFSGFQKYLDQHEAVA
jgi:hypothetical protein